jgi:hypothetical protein
MHKPLHSDVGIRRTKGMSRGKQAAKHQSPKFVKTLCMDPQLIELSYMLTYKGSSK